MTKAKGPRGDRPVAAADRDKQPADALASPVVSPVNRIKAGDPRAGQTTGDVDAGFPVCPGKPASFTRFVLPAPYRLTKLPGKGSHTHWFEEARAEDWLHSATVPGRQRSFEGYFDLERRGYFTRETSNVLFQRARWLVLRQEAGGTPLADSFPLRVTRNGNPIELTVQMRPPALVLFECPRTPDHRPRVGALQQAMIVIELWWRDPQGESPVPHIEDVLVLNELFRYFSPPFQGHARLPACDGPDAHNYRRRLGGLPVDWRKPNERLDSVSGQEEAGLQGWYLRRWDWMLECPLRLTQGPVREEESQEDGWWSLMPPQWIERARTWAGGFTPSPPVGSGDHEAEFGWLSYADNRAFVWTCAVLEEEAPLLRVVGEWGSRGAQEMGTDFGHWLRLVNMDSVDPKESITCTPFEAAWAGQRTYRRWAHCGTLQGFNYHGGAMLTGPVPEPPTWRHFGGMYFDQALLLLYLRVTLFQFSYQLSDLSARARACNDDHDAMEHLANAFEEVRFDFALFTNLYQFPLLSNQQQGIEIYTLCRSQMDVRELFQEVENEVKATHEFLALRAQHEMGRTSARLTVVATVGLGIGLALSLFSADYILKPLFGDPLGKGTEVVLVLVIFVLSMLGVLLLVHRSTRLQRLFDDLAQCSGEFDVCLGRGCERLLSGRGKNRGGCASEGRDDCRKEMRSR